MMDLTVTGTIMKWNVRHDHIILELPLMRFFDRNHVEIGGYCLAPGDMYYIIDIDEGVK